MIASSRGVEVVVMYERARGAHITTVSAGHSPALAAALTRIAAENLPVAVPASADLVTVHGEEVRIIEIKARGGKGPVELPDRQLETFRCAGVHSWLYVVWNTTQPQPVELWTVRDPIRLPWLECRAAERPSGTMRGVRHEARYSVAHAEIEAAASRVDLASTLEALPDPPTWLGPARD